MAKDELSYGRMNIHSHFSGHQWAIGDFGHFVLRNGEDFGNKLYYNLKNYTDGVLTRQKYSESLKLQFQG